MQQRLHTEPQPGCERAGVYGAESERIRRCQPVGKRGGLPFAVVINRPD
jgi:hypothetical protein